MIFIQILFYVESCTKSMKDKQYLSFYVKNSECPVLILSLWEKELQSEGALPIPLHP